MSVKLEFSVDGKEWHEFSDHAEGLAFDTPQFVIMPRDRMKLVNYPIDLRFPAYLTPHGTALIKDLRAALDSELARIRNRRAMHADRFRKLMGGEAPGL